MIFFNGSSGGLGRHFSAALRQLGRKGAPVQARLGDMDGLRRELSDQSRRTSGKRPMVFVQMAARVSVPDCERDAEGAHKTNVDDTAATVLAFVRWAQDETKATPHVVYVSSAHVYAAAPLGTRLTETAPLAPRSVYATTKLRAEDRLRAASEREGFSLVLARVFGLISPLQRPSYVLQGLIRRVRENNPTGVPGLSFTRDFLDSRDVCDHLVTFCSGTPTAQDVDVVNVCSGIPVTLRQLLENIAHQSRPSGADEFLMSVTEAPGRPDDVPWIVGDPDKLIRFVGTPQRVPLGQTISDALELVGNKKS